jgi:hypothetical protein
MLYIIKLGLNGDYMIVSLPGDFLDRAKNTGKSIEMQDAWHVQRFALSVCCIGDGQHIISE